MHADLQPVLDLKGVPLEQLLGRPDDLKFCSSMTLFEAADPAESLFTQAIERLCPARDPRTLALLTT